MKNYSKIQRFKKESIKHRQLRYIAYKWLWQHGYRAFASFINIEPYGIVDVVACKSNELIIIDVIDSFKEFKKKSLDIDSLEHDKRMALDSIINRINPLPDLDMTNDVFVQSNINIISTLSKQIEEDSLYWRMKNTFVIANKYYSIYPEECEILKKINGWGHIRVSISNKTNDLKPYTIQESDSYIISELISKENITSSMLRSSSNELSLFLPKNIILDSN